VTAGPVLNERQAAEDPHLAATGAWAEIPATEDYPATLLNAPPYQFSSSNVALRTPPALLGEHNDYVYREVLGLADAEIAGLEAAGHITTTYANEVLGR
jgi:crotonobetainyl-CoA:carnitine CoA-transferase CaiB-like acyl-CoA transferase